MKPCLKKHDELESIKTLWAVEIVIIKKYEENGSINEEIFCLFQFENWTVRMIMQQHFAHFLAPALCTVELV